MKALALAMLLAAAAVVAPAQRHKLTINAETPEGQLLQKIGQEADEAAKLGLLEQFATQYPKHEAAGWVYAQMVALFAKGNQPDKVLDTGEKLLALDPEDVETAHAGLKAAEAKKDADAVKKWSARTSEVARKVAQSPKPTDEEEVEAWKNRVDFAKQVDVYSEYALYATAVQMSDPKKTADLAQTLEKRNPQSQYLPQMYSQYFLALRQLNDVATAVSVAEKVFEKDQTNEDMLLVVADYYMQQKKVPEKVLTYCGKIIELMGAKQKPAGVSDVDWEKKKKLALGLAHWMTGVTYVGQNKFAQGDKSLRDSLPFVTDNEQMLAPALFYLGMANFRLGDSGKDKNRILEAVKFNQQCAAIKSPYQAQAQKNLAAIRSQYSIR